MSLSAADLDWATTVVRQWVPPTPQVEWPLLAELTGARVWAKHENHTPVGAFKVRGGLTYVARLLVDRPDVTRIVSATRGNHGQSLAFAGRAAGLDVTIVAPIGNSTDKNAAMRSLGADLVLSGDDFQSSVEHAMALAERTGAEMVPSYHQDLVVGVATYAAELFEAVTDLDVVYVPIGLGSGISGLIQVRDLLGLSTQIVGVVAANAAAVALSVEQGRLVSTDSADTFADGVACRTPNAEALGVIMGGAARVLRVSEDEVAAAMRHQVSATHNLAEPAGALALAGLLQEHDQMRGANVAVIVTGANVDAEVLSPVLQGLTPRPR